MLTATDDDLLNDWLETHKEDDATPLGQFIMVVKLREKLRRGLTLTDAQRGLLDQIRTAR